jgi:LmbE family N-acetylglucosaminyl deacetylase
MGFHPTDYVDITAVREKKKAALFSHKSQNGEEIYRRHHEPMENLRGREAGTAAAEAFVHLARVNGASPLPGLG